ncbi:hypothetical protein PanWU01x14_150430 [Parasponia andersonii]|uniref:Uncharacterized protein n=1 Tax=Parasponia andersonii TaxID=3476 RepID=A0A2P5CI70_PARAD|nr:hypothetical protein PanWU01x14_150430 [Parasponia andersonii]
MVDIRTGERQNRTNESKKKLLLEKADVGVREGLKESRFCLCVLEAWPIRRAPVPAHNVVCF